MDNPDLAVRIFQISQTTEIFWAVNSLQISTQRSSDILAQILDAGRVALQN